MLPSPQTAVWPTEKHQPVGLRFPGPWRRGGNAATTTSAPHLQLAWSRPGQYGHIYRQSTPPHTGCTQCKTAYNALSAPHTSTAQGTVKPPRHTPSTTPPLPPALHPPPPPSTTPPALHPPSTTPQHYTPPALHPQHYTLPALHPPALQPSTTPPSTTLPQHYTPPALHPQLHAPPALHPPALHPSTTPPQHYTPLQ